MTFLYALAGVPFRGIPTSPFVQEVTMAAPDTVRVEVRDPLIQRGVIQFSGTQFPGTNGVWTTATNPVTGQTDNCTPLGPTGYLLTQRFDDVVPTNWYNRPAGDVAANWGISGNLSITNVYRKSYPYCEGTPHFVNGIPNGSNGLYSQTASRHYLWLKLSGPLVSGTTYTITPPAGTGLSQITLAFNDTQTRASSILANQAGHRAGDELKLGYLSQYIPSAPNEGQINFASTYSISSFNIIDKNGTVVYTGSVTERGSPTTVEGGDNNSGYLRIYRSADPTRALPITGVTFANPGVFTTTAPMTNGQIVALQGFGKGLQLTGMSWSSANGGTVTFTGPNSQSSNSYTVGTWFTISGASPSGYNGTFQAIAGTNSSQLVAAMAVNPGAATVNGVMSNPAGVQITPSSGNSSNYFVVANATSSAPYTFTLKQMSLPSGTAGADVSTAGLGPWGPGTFLTPSTAAAIGADTNFGVGFDSLIIPCYQANRAGTHVYGCDYSAATLSSSGSPYRVQIPGLGVSDPIPASDASWYDIAWNYMKGIYHQTSGKAIDNRFGYYRPDALIDGVNGTELFTSLLPMGFTSEDGGYAGASEFVQGYIALAPFIQPTRGPAGLGGAYHDAGDWTSVGWQHLQWFYALLDIGYEFCGGTTASIAAAQSTNFNFPKASTTWGSMFSPIDTMSDAVHAAVYIAEYYRLTQDQYGAVASGNSFGSIGFGDGGASETVPSSASAYAFALSAPEPVCNYYFALLALKLAIIFYNAGITGTGSLSDIYATAAINAFNWAEGVRTGVMTDSEFYFGKTPYNGTALNIPSNSALASPLWTSSSTGTTVNGVGALGTITSSSDFTNGTYADIPLTGGSGTGAIATIIVSSNKVSSVLVTRPGNNFAVSDLLSCVLSSIGGGTSFSVPVNSVVQTTTLDTTLTKPGQLNTSLSPIGTITGGTGGTPGIYPGVALTTSGSGTGAVATITVGAGGNVTTVNITTPGKGYRYPDTLSANSADIGGVTGFSTTVKYISDGSGGVSNTGLVARTAAAGILYRWYAITGQSLTSIQNIFIEGAGKTLNDTGFWEIYNSPNNATPLAIINSLNYPSAWTNGASNYVAAAQNSTNAYYTAGTSGGTIGSNFNTVFMRGYIDRVRRFGTSDSICVGVRQMMAAQLSLTLGANPSGLCVTTGIGQRNTLGTLHRDWQACAHLVTGFQPPPAGLTPYGWASAINASGFAEFLSDNPADWTVVTPTGIYERSNGSKRIVNPHVQAMPMWEQLVENSGCITTMEFPGTASIVSLYVPALTLWCWDGNTVKS